MHWQWCGQQTCLSLSLTAARRGGRCDHCFHFTGEKNEVQRWIKGELYSPGATVKITGLEVTSTQHNKENEYSSLGRKTKFWRSLIFRLHCVLWAPWRTGIDWPSPPGGNNNRSPERGGATPPSQIHTHRKHKPCLIFRKYTHTDC